MYMYDQVAVILDAILNLIIINNKKEIVKTVQRQWLSDKNQQRNKCYHHV